MLTKPVRQIISEMRKVCSNTIRCNNGTEIVIHEINANKNDYIGKIKWNPDGSVKVIRGFFCTIIPSRKTVGLEEFKKDRNIWLYNPKVPFVDNFFHENDYYLKERMMNEFISDNGDVDHYATVTKFAYMMSDVMSMMDDMED